MRTSTILSLTGGLILGATGLMAQTTDSTGAATTGATSGTVTTETTTTDATTTDTAATTGAGYSDDVARAGERG